MFGGSIAQGLPCPPSTRDLYASAAYADALTMLDRLAQRPGRAALEPGVELYRALCLFALGKSSEADHALEDMIAQAPTYQPSDADPARVHARLVDVRRRVLPVIVQQRYTPGQGGIRSQGLHVREEMGFRQMLDALADPDVATVANQPPLADLRTLAIGFRNIRPTSPLSTSLVSPCFQALPLPGPVAAVPAPVSARAVTPRIHGARTGVMAPVIVSQPMPPYPWKVLAKRVGAVEVVVDEKGAVQIRHDESPNGGAVRRAGAGGRPPLALPAAASPASQPSPARSLKSSSRPERGPRCRPGLTA